MNTPAHAALGLVVLGRAERDALPVAIGGLLPDLPMLWFYVWERFVRGVPERTIWAERYFAPEWQTSFDLPNSIPLIALALGIVIALGRRAGTLHQGKARWWALLLASMLLHALADLPLHREDAHRHFFPFSDWKFMSPVSYWDPAHYGAYVGMVEIAFVLVATVLLWRRYQGRLARTIVGFVAAVYAAFGLFAVLTWSGLAG